MIERGYRNVHGRRWGRGARPYLLVLKLAGASGFLGGLVSVLVVVLLSARPNTAEGWLTRAELIRRAFVFVIVPGLTAAMFSGLLLLASAWRALIRMRWFRVKALLVAVVVPALHVWMRNRSLDLQHAVSEPVDLRAANTIHDEMLVGTAGLILFALVIITLGRVKPRLGQSYGRTFAKQRDEND
jgi:hypothetical protein